MSVRTLLVGLDGATFSLLDRFMADGTMPFVRSLAERGARADLQSVVPPLTPPAWTSLMTGRSPGHHGVFDFFKVESLERWHIRFATSHDVSTETIWALASQHGLRVTALNFPLMFPPPRIPGFVVPGWVPWKQLRLACHPPGLFDRLKALPNFEPRELAMDWRLEEKATEGCTRDEYLPWIDFHIARERNWLRILQYLTSEEPSPLTAVLFDGVDKLQHLCWRFVDPAADVDAFEDWEREVATRAVEYYRRLDDIIAQACTALPEDGTVVIASDHGFGPSTEVFHVNAWLAEKGYLGWSEAALSQNETGEATLGVSQVARHTYLLDWNRTLAFATTPTSNGIYIVVDREGTGRGVPPAEYEGFRRRLIAELHEVRDPATGEPIVTRVWTREEAFAGPFVTLAPDLTMALRDGGLISILPSDRPVRARPEVAGVHRPNGVFMAAGPGIRPGARVDALSILDVAPLLCYRLGLPVPNDWEGRVPVEILDPAYLAAHPIRRGGTTAPVGAGAREGTPAALDAEDEAVVMQRLRQLGYID